MTTPIRKLIAPQLKHQQTKPVAPAASMILVPLLEITFSSPLPTISLISSTTQSQLLAFLKIYLKFPPTPQTLLHFLKIMRKMIDGRPSVAVYNILIYVFVKNGQHDKALCLYDQLILDRVKPDIFTFNILISSYCKSSHFHSALALFKEMRAKSCEPNMVTFNTLIKGLFKERKYEEGISMGYEMIKLRCQLSIVTCESLVNGLCAVGKTLRAYVPLIESNAGQALEVVEEMCKAGKSPGMIACSTLAEGLRKGGNVDDALRLRLFASSKGLDADIVTYNILVNGYSREGKIKEGKLLVEEMLDRDYISDITS